MIFFDENLVIILFFYRKTKVTNLQKKIPPTKKYHCGSVQRYWTIKGLITLPHLFFNPTRLKDIQLNQKSLIQYITTLPSFQVRTMDHMNGGTKNSRRRAQTITKNHTIPKRLKKPWQATKGRLSMVPFWNNQLSKMRECMHDY